MKHFLSNVFTITVISIVFFGCSKDKDKEPDPILGSWTWATDAYSGCSDASSNNTTSFTCSASYCYTRTFNADGTMVIHSVLQDNDVTIAAQYTIKGSNLTMLFDGDAIEVGYSISGTTLSLDYGTDADTGCHNVETYNKN